MESVLSCDVRNNEKKINCRRLAWSASDQTCEKFTGLPAMRVYLAVCGIFTIVCLGLWLTLAMDNLSIRKLADVLLSPHGEALKKTKDLGLIGKLFRDEKILSDKINTFAGWANNSKCITGDGLLYRNSCYRLTRREMTYELVEKYCAIRDGLVAVAHNEEEWYKILEYLWSIGFDRTNQLWMGLQKNSSDGFWYNSNGKEATFLKWGRGNIFDEGFNCAQLRTDVKEKAGLYDRRCEDSSLALCMFSVT